MRVLYDHMVFTWQRYGGVSRYFIELMKRLRGRNVDYTLPVVLTNNNYLRHSKISKYLWWAKKDIKGTFHIMEPINRWKTRSQLRANRYDLFHPTSTNDYFLTNLNQPFVITVHDLTVELFPDYFNNPEYVRRTIASRQKLYQQAARIIAVSHNTKNDLLNFYGVPAEKVDVIYHGYTKISPGLDPDRNFDFLDQPFVLYVGSRKEYKNFGTFVTGAATLVRDGVNIVCVGGGPFTRDEQSLLRKLSIESGVYQVNLPDRELTYLYQRAQVFVYPSLYEGFGLPIIEALTNGCPVACSDLPVFREVALDQVTYFDPYDADAIGEAISAVISQEVNQAGQAELGKTIAAKYNWDITADQTISTYQKAIQQKTKL